MFSNNDNWLSEGALHVNWFDTDWFSESSSDAEDAGWSPSAYSSTTSDSDYAPGNEASSLSSSPATTTDDDDEDFHLLTFMPTAQPVASSSSSSSAAAPSSVTRDIYSAIAQNDENNVQSLNVDGTFTTTSKFLIDAVSGAFHWRNALVSMHSLTTVQDMISCVSFFCRCSFLPIIGP